MNHLSKTDSVKSPEIVDLLFCSVVSGCVPKVSFLLYRMMRSVFSEWAALPQVVLLIRWLAHRAGFGREAPVALGLQSTWLPWVPSFCPGLSFCRLFPVWSPRPRFSLLVPLIWWYCDRMRVHTFFTPSTVWVQLPLFTKSMWPRSFVWGSYRQWRVNHHLVQ